MLPGHPAFQAGRRTFDCGGRGKALGAEGFPPKLTQLPQPFPKPRGQGLFLRAFFPRGALFHNFIENVFCQLMEPPGLAAGYHAAAANGAAPGFCEGSISTVFAGVHVGCHPFRFPRLRMVGEGFPPKPETLSLFSALFPRFIQENREKSWAGTGKMENPVTISNTCTVGSGSYRYRVCDVCPLFVQKAFQTPRQG